MERRIQVKLELGADSWDDVVSELKHIATEISRGHYRLHVVSGGYSTGFILTATEDENMTGEIYRNWLSQNHLTGGERGRQE